MQTSLTPTHLGALGLGLIIGAHLATHPVLVTCVALAALAVFVAWHNRQVEEMWAIVRKIQERYRDVFAREASGLPTCDR